jgi:hypothetical protein
MNRESGLASFWAMFLVLLAVAALLIPSVVFAQAKVMPHLFIGSVTDLDGRVFDDETEPGIITAWVDANGDGNYQEIVSAHIENGIYQIMVESPDGVNFDQKTVKFTVDGKPTDRIGSWESGQASQLSLKLLPAPAPASAPTSAPPPTSAATPAAPQAQPTMQPREAGFRENPTMRLRPVTDEITADQDGIVEIFMFNPSVNDVPLSVDIVIAVPSGIHVYGEGFSCSGSGAGACSGSFTILPGQSKGGHLNIKAAKTGSHQVHFTGYWWPGGNKDLRQPISLTHPFNVSEPSKDPSEAPESLQEPTATAVPTRAAQPVSPQTPGGCSLSPPGGAMPLGALALAFGVVVIAGRKIF